MLFSLNTNTSTVNLLNTIALNDTLVGQAAAQAALGCILNYSFTEPRLHPDPNDVNYRLANITQASNLTNISSDLLVNVYPNPSQKGIFVDIQIKEEIEMCLEIKDLLGRNIFTKFVRGSINDYVPLDDYNNGVYFLVITNKEKQTLYKSKLIKQD
jgi:Secretion system C-terminal sorting domain